MQLLSIVIIILCIIIIIITFVFGGDLVPVEKTGEWIKNSVGKCINDVKGECSTPGKQFIVSRCETNIETGLGCLNESGIIQYGIKIEERDCEVVCKSLLFENITPPDQVCVAKSSNGTTLLPNQCFDNITGIATLTETYKCVKGDATGINTCTEVSSDGSLTIYQLGDIVEKEIPCDSFVQNVCGVWTYDPNAVAGTNIIVEEINVEASLCNFDPSFIFSNVCITENNSNFQEGFIQKPLTCNSLIYNESKKKFEQSVITPIKTNDIGNICENLSFTTCNNSIPTFTDIQNIVNIENNGLICSDVEGYENQTCLTSCRLFNPSVDENYLYVPYIELNGKYYVLFLDDISPGLTSDITLLEVIDDGSLYTQIINQSLFFLFGTGKIIATANQSNTGWVNGTSLVWNKMRKGYSQTGVLSNIAQIYNISFGTINNVNYSTTVPTGSVNSSGVFQNTGVLTISQERIINIKNGNSPVVINYEGNVINISNIPFLMIPFDDQENIDFSKRINK